MKQLVSFLVPLCCCMLCGAQTTSITIDNLEAGTLTQRLSNINTADVENLTVIGEINGDDFSLIRDLNKQKLKGSLDLSLTKIVKGGKYYYGGEEKSTTEDDLCLGIFGDLERFRKIIVPNTIKTLSSASYSYGAPSYYAYIPTDSLIINCPNLKSVSGVGNPKYLYIGEGPTNIWLYTRYRHYSVADYYLTYGDSLELYLPSTLKNLYASKTSEIGSPYISIYSSIVRPDLLNDGNLDLPWKTFFENGEIHIPEGTKDRYDNSIFRSMRIIEPISVKVITLSQDFLSLKVNESKTIFANVYPDNADNKEVLWSCSDENILKVNQTGEFTALNPGQAIVTARSLQNPEIKAECSVTVVQPVKGISLNKTALELVEDESEQLIKTILPEDASNKSVNWTSSDISVAMVSPDGTVYAVKEGQSTIMATTVDGGFVALCKVTVKAKTVLAEDLTLSKTSANLAVSESVQLTASLSPDNVTNKSLRWSSTNTSVASVSENGLVTGISEGTAQIIVTTTDGSNLSAICNVVVEKQLVSIKAISLNPTSLKIEVSDRKTLSPVITPANATNQNLIWSSTNAAVASVSLDGVVTGVNEGKAIIIATTQDGSNLSATCEVEVFRNLILVTSIVLNPDKIDGKEEETCQILATVFPENADNKDILWTSSNSEVADVDLSGLVTLKSKGTANITASSTDGSNIKAECLVIVSEKSDVNHIFIDKNSYVKIYTLSGILIYEGEYSQANLASGTYIMLTEGKVIKQFIK